MDAGGKNMVAEYSMFSFFDGDDEQRNRRRKAAAFMTMRHLTQSYAEI